VEDGVPAEHQLSGGGEKRGKAHAPCPWAAGPQCEVQGQLLQVGKAGGQEAGGPGRAADVAEAGVPCSCTVCTVIRDGGRSAKERDVKGPANVQHRGQSTGSVRGRSTRAAASTRAAEAGPGGVHVLREAPSLGGSLPKVPVVQCG